MITTVQAVINAAADDADSLLEGIATPAEAKPLLREWLADHHPAIAPTERDEIVAGILSLLAREGFFEAAAGDETNDSAEMGEPDE